MVALTPLNYKQKNKRQALVGACLLFFTVFSG